MSQNGRKMAKIIHNAAKKFDWVFPFYLFSRPVWCLYFVITSIMSQYTTQVSDLIALSIGNTLMTNLFLQWAEISSRGNFDIWRFAGLKILGWKLLYNKWDSELRVNPRTHSHTSNRLTVHILVLKLNVYKVCFYFIVGITISFQTEFFVVSIVDYHRLWFSSSITIANFDRRYLAVTNVR